MHFRHRTTKAVREVSGNSPEGRELSKSNDWDRIESGRVDEPDLPPGVMQPPEPVVSDD